MNSDVGSVSIGSCTSLFRLPAVWFCFSTVGCPASGPILSEAALPIEPWDWLVTCLTLTCVATWDTISHVPVACSSQLSWLLWRSPCYGSNHHATSMLWHIVILAGPIAPSNFISTGCNVSVECRTDPVTCLSISGPNSVCVPSQLHLISIAISTLLFPMRIPTPTLQSVLTVFLDFQKKGIWMLPRVSMILPCQCWI